MTPTLGRLEACVRALPEPIDLSAIKVVGRRLRSRYQKQCNWNLHASVEFSIDEERFGQVGLDRQSGAVGASICNLRGHEGGLHRKSGGNNKTTIRSAIPTISIQRNCHRLEL